MRLQFPHEGGIYVLRRENARCRADAPECGHGRKGGDREGCRAAGFCISQIGVPVLPEPRQGTLEKEEYAETALYAVLCE